jgi:tetratricopeptide (TPR) repeat protein
VYKEKDLSHFNGDQEFLTNDFAAKAFSKLRVSIAGFYQWRLMNGSGTGNVRRLNLEADYAFRQAYALCPTSPEVLFRYVNFLMAQRRFDDAILIVRTTLRLTPVDSHFYDQYENLMMQLKQYREQAGRVGN